MRPLQPGAQPDTRTEDGSDADATVAVDDAIDRCCCCCRCGRDVEGVCSTKPRVLLEGVLRRAAPTAPAAAAGESAAAALAVSETLAPRGVLLFAAWEPPPPSASVPSAAAADELAQLGSLSSPPAAPLKPKGEILWAGP